MGASIVNSPFTGAEAGDSNRVDYHGESALLRSIRDWLGPVAPPPPEGMGDDCAVLRPIPTGHQQLLTTDSLTYGQHFDAAARPEDAGAKLIKRNLSDIAAMGGQPGPALLNLLCGPDLSIIWLERFISGIRASCERYGVMIVGGDISALPAGQFTASLTLTGYAIGEPILRTGAAVGDFIYVTGTLGGSLRGKHLAFEPRLAAGQWLATQPTCTAMMDLTDGLGKDLAALLPQGSSAAIDLCRLPASPAAHQSAVAGKRSIQEHIFCDGEDYELLFTVTGTQPTEPFEKAWSEQFPALALSAIGRIIPAHPAGRYVDAKTEAALPWQSGFEHFKPA